MEEISSAAESCRVTPASSSVWRRWVSVPQDNKCLVLGFMPRLRIPEQVRSAALCFDLDYYGLVKTPLKARFSRNIMGCVRFH